MIVSGYELHELKDNATGEHFDYGVWLTCPVCGEDSLARFHGEIDTTKQLRALAAKLTIQCQC